MHQHHQNGRGAPAPTSIITITPATTDDELATWLDVRNRAVPDFQLTMEDIHASIYRNPRQVRLVATCDDQPVAIAVSITDRLGPPGAMFAQVKVLESHRRRGIGSRLFEHVSVWARAQGGTYFQVGVRDVDASSMSFFAHRGYEQVERDEVVQLNLAEPAPERGRVCHEIEIVALGDRPDLYESVYRVGAATWGDVPSHEPPSTIGYEEWVSCFTTVPGCSPDHLFVAIVGSEAVGYAQLELPPGEPGTAWNGFTGVTRAWRGRGVARALKLHQIQWARAHGLERIMTSNHTDNAPMRHLNCSLGFTPAGAQLLLRGPIPAGDSQDLRVARVDRGECTVLDIKSGARLRAQAPPGLAVGDRITLGCAHDGSLPTVSEVLPRRGVISRGAANGKTADQVLAANVDSVLVVCSLEQAVNPRRLERFLALAWAGSATPVVVLSKADLVGDDLPSIIDQVKQASGGADVVAISIYDESTLDALWGVLRPVTTTVMVGPSGVGKSTIVNHLAPHANLAVQQTRGDGKGRHTTTHRELLVLANGALLIDTPGVRSVQLWDAGEGIARTFSDIEDISTTCRFSDCAHVSEPGCAVLDAIARGELDQLRLTSYRKLQREQARLEQRQDTRARIERGRALRLTSKHLRSNPQQRRR